VFGDTIGHDGVFENNAGAFLGVGPNQPADNGGTGPGFGNDLTLTNNTEGFNDLSNTTIGDDCSQSNNRPYAGSGNTAGSNVDACNSTNS
jgi:hypothetical protein